MVSAGTLGLVVVVVTIAGSAVFLRISLSINNAFSRILN
jgi:hypothetical protein